MNSRTNTMLMLSITAIIVGLALAQNTHCRGTCQQLARNIYGQGVRGTLRALGFLA